ncbi:hypothetical protein AC791_02545 [Klebsiella sp. RIT-PI-d]|nr:hypothetical protein AC791_02545 [Klebsiella sp. RIT-PI-d]
MNNMGCFIFYLYIIGYNDKLINLSSWKILFLLYIFTTKLQLNGFLIKLFINNEYIDAIIFSVLNLSYGHARREDEFFDFWHDSR